MPYKPALVNVVHSEGAQAEDEKHSYEHVVNGTDVADLKQFTDEEKHTKWKHDPNIVNIFHRQEKLYKMSVKTHVPHKLDVFIILIKCI